MKNYSGYYDYYNITVSNIYILYSKNQKRVNTQIISGMFLCCNWKINQIPND